MKTPRFHVALLALFCLILLSCNQSSQTEASPQEVSTLAPSSETDTSLGSPSLFVDNPNPPATPVKLIFIHHSTGGMWLADKVGGLGKALKANNYFVSATNYGWGPDGIGDRTDIINWPEWFTGVNRDTYMSELFNENGQNFGDFGKWSRLRKNPGGENQIIVFKSCFPNSDMWGAPDDPPADEINDQNTIGNAKAIYIDLLSYFVTRTDKLFIVITAPPLAEGDYLEGNQTASERSSNIRAFNNWLMNDWLVDYPYSNVAVFDYYNVLTSNGSEARTDLTDTNKEPNDAGREDGNHHRWLNGTVQHIQTVDNNYSAYPSASSGDSHPINAGQQKATEEFVLLLNVFYNRWVANIGADNN